MTTRFDDGTPGSAIIPDLSKTPPSMQIEPSIKTGWNNNGKVQLALIAVARSPDCIILVLKPNKSHAVIPIHRCGW